MKKWLQELRETDIIIVEGEHLRYSKPWNRLMWVTALIVGIPAAILIDLHFLP